MTVAKRSSLQGQSAIYEESNRMVSPPPLYRSDTPSVASISPLVTPTASTGLPASEEDTVKVTVRCRPPSKIEVARNSETCWDVDSEHNRISLTNTWAVKPGVRTDSIGTIDNVFYGSDNELLYAKSVHPIIQSTMRGYNGTVFAYGQTASGKTYTMIGRQCNASTEDEPGVIPRAVNDVFSIISETTEKEFLLRVSYLEIYNETLKDLLSPDSEDLRIHEDKKRGVYVSSLREEIVTSPKHVMKVIQRGEANRHVSSTDFNLHSSRSHTVFQLIVESREKEPRSMPCSPTSQKSSSFLRTDQKRSVQVSQLNLIDLAGSEKAASQSDRRKEGAFINKSLLTLGTVISKLTEDKVSSHIPYRDSKLTRILQSSLSGNARIAVICTISPCHQSLEESQNTLKFAARVKKVVTSASTNEIIDDRALLQKYRNEINDLRVQLQSNNEIFSRERETNLTLLQEKQKHEEQLMEMQLVRTALKERIDHLTKLILTSGSISAKGLGERPVPSLSSHTKSVPDDQRVDHVDKGETDRLRRENTELQIIIDELRETIRTQSSELEESLNEQSHHEDDDRFVLLEQNNQHQVHIYELEEELYRLTTQKSHLEALKDDLRAEIDRRDNVIKTLKADLSEAQEALRSNAEQKNTHHASEGAAHDVQALKKEVEEFKLHCSNLEEEKDSLKIVIQMLEDEVKELIQSKSAPLRHEVLDHTDDNISIRESSTKSCLSNGTEMKKTSKEKSRQAKNGNSREDLAQLSYEEDAQDEMDETAKGRSEALEKKEADGSTTLSDHLLSTMFTLGPEIEYIVISLLLSVLVFLIVDNEDERAEL